MFYSSLSRLRLSETQTLHTTSPILTLDTHFRIYRKSGRTVIPTLMPSERLTPDTRNMTP